MAIEDLDLEFEDETEKEKGDALDVEVDLSFSASPESVKEHMANNQAKPTPKPRPAAAARPVPQKVSSDNNVANINQARTRATAAQPQPQPQARPTTQVQPTPEIDSSELAALRSEIELLKGQIQNIQQQADIKIAVAQAERDFLVEYVSNAKVMDHQVTQILTRINKKVPALSSEVQTIKKYVSEFVKKATPKKGEK